MKKKSQEKEMLKVNSKKKRSFVMKSNKHTKENKEITKNQCSINLEWMTSWGS